MRNRDVGILAVCALAILFSFSAHDSVAVHRLFFHQVDPAWYENGFSPTMLDRLPSPVVTDIDGDGTNEIVLATREPAVYILQEGAVSEDNPNDKMKARRAADAANAGQYAGKADFAFWPKYAVRASASLLPAVRVSFGRYPVAVATGYLDEYDAEDAEAREQNIIVVTHEWTVLCFDGSLKLQWEYSLQERFRAGFSAWEVSVLIAPNPLFVGDRGMVVVGGRTHKKESEQERFGHEYGDEYDTNDDMAGAMSREEFDDMMTEATLLTTGGYFSYYALDGGRGTLRWRHEVSDFQQATLAEEVTFPQRNYKLDLKSDVAHAAEVDWRLYKDSIMANLPFSWSGPEDTRLDTAHFVKQRRRESRTTGHTEVAGTATASKRSSSGDVDDHTDSPDPSEARFGDGAPSTGGASAAASADALGASAGAGAGGARRANNYQRRLDRDEEDHQADSWVKHAMTTSNQAWFKTYDTHRAAATDFVDRPNVIVAHLREGIEVIHLYSGQSVCKLSLDEGVYTDMNGDGVVDHAIGYVGERSASHILYSRLDTPKCFGIISSGVPVYDHLGNNSMCGGTHALKNMLFTTAAGMDRSGGGDLGSGEDEASGEEDPDYFADSEQLTTLNPVVLHRANDLHQMDVVFAINAGLVTSMTPDGRFNWRTATKSTWASDLMRRARDEDTWNFYTSVPSMQVFHPAETSPEEMVLVTGDKWMTLLTADGDISAEVHLPDMPVGLPVMADMDNDGLTDVLVPTRLGYYAFSVVPQQSMTFFRVLVLFFVVLIAAVFIYRQVVDLYSTTGRRQHRHKAALD